MTTSNQIELVNFASEALVAGMELGFNAAGVERWLDAETFEPRLSITWGDQTVMRLPRLRTPCEWVLSYSEEVGCMRAPKTIQYDESILSQPASEMRRRFHEQLLELL